MSAEGVIKGYGWASDYFTVKELVKLTMKGEITNYAHANPLEERVALACLKGKPCLSQAE